MSTRLTATAALTRASLALLAGSLLVAGYLTVALRSTVDPVTTVMSDYVFHHPGGPLFVVMIVLLVLGGGALLAGLIGLGVPCTTSVRTLFGLWYMGLLLCAVFPTNRTADSSSLSGDIHRLAGGTFLVSLPMAGWRIATAVRHDPRWRAIAVGARRCSVVGLLAVAAFGVGQLRLMAPGLPGAWLLPSSDVQGLLERFALGAQVALLVVLALPAARATAGVR